MSTKQKNCVLLLILILTSTIFLGPTHIQQIDGIIEEVQESIDVPTVDSSSNEITPSIKTTSVDYNTWYEGESVKTDIEFNKQIMDLGLFTESVYPEYAEGSFHIGIPYYAYSDNEVEHDMQWIFSTPQVDGFVLAFFQIYCGGSGNLLYESFGVVTDNVSSSITTTEANGEYSILNSYLTGGGYVNLAFYLWSSKTSTNLKLHLIKPDGGWLTIFTVSGTGSIANVYDFLISTDELAFTRDTVVSNIRSEYKYASTTVMSHRLEIPSVPHAKEINIYYDDSRLSYSSINPYADLTFTSGIATITSPTELTYSVFFSSNYSNLLPIKDISTEYLRDVGFENSKADLSNIITGKFDNYELASDIVSTGVHSLKGTDTDGSSDVFNFNIDYRGRLYCSFDYYLVSGYTWTELRVYYRVDDSTWAYQNLSFGSSESWNKIFVSFDLQGVEESNNRNIVIQFQSGQGSVYIDNLRFLKTSTQIRTTGLEQYQIDTTLISWDGYQNPVIPYENLEYELWYSTLEDSYSTTTNNEGVATWNLNKDLDLKEYQIRAYSVNDHSCDSLYGWNKQDWLYGGTWDCIGDSSQSFTIYDNYLEMILKTGSTPGSLYTYNNLDSAFDYSMFDKVIVDMEFNETEQHYSSGQVVLYDFTDVDRLKDLTDYPVLADERTVYNYDFILDRYISNCDETNLQRIYPFVMERDIYDGLTVFLYDYYFIETIKYNFTTLAFSENPSLSESDSYFFLESTNNTNQYEIFIDNSYLGFYNDLEVIFKNNTIGEHNFTYVLFTDGAELAYIPETYSYFYAIERFYNVKLRYIPINFVGLAIGTEFDVNDVLTYLDGSLIESGVIGSYPENSNYSFISNDDITINNNVSLHNLVVKDLFGRLILNTTINISNFTYSIMELPIYRLGIINNDNDNHRVGIKLYLTDDAWQITPILPPGYWQEYWVREGTYDIRVYSIGTVINTMSLMDGSGNITEIYDQYEDYPAETVPFYFEIPLTLDDDRPDPEVKEEKWYEKAYIWGITSTALIVVLTVSAYFIYRAIKKRDEKKA